MSAKINCSECDNSACLIKKHCLPLWIKKIESDKMQLHYKVGDYIFREGDKVCGIYFIKHGKAKVISTGINNKKQIVRLGSSGHLLGHRGYGGEKYPVSAIALSNITVCFIDNNSFHNVCINNPHFTMEIINFYSLELRKAESRIKYMGQMSVREKIAEALLYLKDVFGIDKTNRNLNVLLSRQEIADMAGITSAQVLRALRLFEDEKLIAMQDKRNIQLINMPRLKNIVKHYNMNQNAA